MLVVFIRAVILFLIVFFVIRLMGKRELSKVQPFELAIIIMISDIASGPMSSRNMQMFSGVIPILAMLIVYILFTLVIQSGKKVSAAICGTPVLLIFKGKIIEEELKRQQLTVEELMEQLREKDIYKITDVAYAILETNGTLNAMKITDKVNGMPLNIIAEGEYLDRNIKMLGYTKNDINKLLESEKVDVKDILVGSINENGIFEYQKKENNK